MTAVLLLAGALAIVGYGWATGGGVAGRVARMAGRGSRPRMILGWAAGTAVTYGATSMVALVLIGRVDAVVDLPGELIETAWLLGLPGWIGGRDLAWLGSLLGLGVVFGAVILVLGRRMGRGAIGLRYRSAAAVQDRGEWPAAAALAMAAGVGEELFFRLLLPLLVAIVTGSGVAGLAVGWAAFVALHRHQGKVGMIAVAAVGAALSYLYLLTGRLWVPMLVHVVLDLNAFILRPWLNRPPTVRVGSGG